MNFLKWYSSIMVTLAILLLVPDYVGGDSDAMWGIIVYAPIVVYLWIIAIKK